MDNKLKATHHIVEFYGATHLDDVDSIKANLIHSAKEAGCNVLDAYFHKFGENSGVTGVVLLKESHISIHTWPEHHYAAIDIFVCGNTEPLKALEILKRFFSPKRFEIKDLKRGIKL